MGRACDRLIYTNVAYKVFDMLPRINHTRQQSHEFHTYTILQCFQVGEDNQQAENDNLMPVRSRDWSTTFPSVIGCPFSDDFDHGRNVRPRVDQAVHVLESYCRDAILRLEADASAKPLLEALIVARYIFRDLGRAAR